MKRGFQYTSTKEQRKSFSNALAYSIGICFGIPALIILIIQLINY